MTYTGENRRKEQCLMFKDEQGEWKSQYLDDRRNNAAAPFPTAVAASAPSQEDVEQGEKAADAPQGYWWCPNCKEEVNSYHVTHQEMHEECGHSVEWITPVSAAPDAVALLRECRDFLADEQHEHLVYVENGQQYSDLRKWVARIDEFLKGLK